MLHLFYFMRKAQKALHDDMWVTSKTGKICNNIRMQNPGMGMSISTQ